MTNQDKENGMDKGFAASLMYFAALSYSTCFSVFMRKGFGSEALGLNGIAAFFVILLSVGHDGFMAMFLLVWIVALLFQRACTFRMSRLGIHPHSKYAGEPALVYKLIPRITSESKAQSIEPMLCLIVGVLLCPVSQRLGAFVFCGFFSMLIQRAMEAQLSMMRTRRMRDAEIEQRVMADNWKGR
ncbi:MAG: hypothetical protein SGI88_03540 [Candidatus Hydrogenedentes bacterium]|nr:hypothetical protein [Candidatus Hydrogenedentota bacterium]